MRGGRHFSTEHTILYPNVVAAERNQSVGQQVIAAFKVKKRSVQDQ